jgi:hypothetical protein
VIHPHRITLHVDTAYRRLSTIMRAFLSSVQGHLHAHSCCGVVNFSQTRGMKQVSLECLTSNNIAHLTLHGYNELAQSRHSRGLCYTTPCHKQHLYLANTFVYMSNSVSTAKRKRIHACANRSTQCRSGTLSRAPRCQVHLALHSTCMRSQMLTTLSPLASTR